MRLTNSLLGCIAPADCVVERGKPIAADVVAKELAVQLAFPLNTNVVPVGVLGGLIDTRDVFVAGGSNFHGSFPYLV
jgi:hypothetical protein